MSSEVTFTYGKKKGSETDAVFANMENAARPTVGDLLYVGQRQRSRILERTARGLDMDERPFAPYSRKGPIYYYPGKNAKNRRAAVNSVAKQIGMKGNNPKTFTAKGWKEAHTVQKTRLGLKFSSYAALKAAFGRYFVDLRGLKAPHMLQAIIIRVGEFVASDFLPLPTARIEASDTLKIGIYGPESERASGHQTGVPKRNLPKRKFLGLNQRDKTLILADVVARMRARVRAALGQPEGGTPSVL